MLTIKLLQLLIVVLGVVCAETVATILFSFSMALGLNKSHWAMVYGVLCGQFSVHSLSTHSTIDSPNLSSLKIRQ